MRKCPAHPGEPLRFKRRRCERCDRLAGVVEEETKKTLEAKGSWVVWEFMKARYEEHRLEQDTLVLMPDGEVVVVPAWLGWAWLTVDEEGRRSVAKDDLGLAEISTAFVPELIVAASFDQPVMPFEMMVTTKAGSHTFRSRTLEEAKERHRRKVEEIRKIVADHAVSDRSA